MVEITIIGHLTIDEITRRGESRVIMGGTACYAALAAGRLGAKVRLISRVGGDFPARYLDILEGAGVDVSRVAVDPASRSTRFHLDYSTGRRILRLESRAPDIVIESLSGDAVYLGPVAWEISLKDVADLMRSRRSVLLDPQGLMRSWRPDGSVDLKRIDLDIKGLWILRISREEAEVWTSRGEPLEMIGVLEEAGAENVILTLGGEGAVAKWGSRRFLIPCFETVEVDPTGAGDVFGGAFLAEYLETRDVEWALAMGSAMASISVEDFGFHPLLREGVVEEARRRAEVVAELIREL